MVQEKSAAERYREMVAEQRKAAFTYKEVNPATGFEWTLRELDLQVYVLSGKLPLSFLEMMAAAQSKDSDVLTAFDELPEKEKIDAVYFMQFLVKEVAVSPKIVASAVAPDEIDIVLKEDVQFLVMKAMTGRTKTAAGLETFRQGRQQTSTHSANGAELPDKTVKASKGRKRSART